MKISQNNFTQTPGIYVWINTVNGKVYVGQSVNVLNRVQNELAQLRGNYFHNSHMQNAWNKYGEDSFAVGQLMECDVSELDDAEAAWGNHFDARNPEHGYNIQGYGQGKHEMSDETKAKLSEAMKGRKFTDEHKANLSSALKGREFTDEHKAKISESNRGRKVSAETRQKMRDAWTDERREKMGCDYDVDTIMYYYNMGLSFTDIKKLTGADSWVVRKIVSKNPDLVENNTLTKVEAYKMVKAGILKPKKAAALGKFPNLGTFKRWYNEWLIKNEN